MYHWEICTVFPLHPNSTGCRDIRLSSTKRKIGYFFLMKFLIFIHTPKTRELNSLCTLVLEWISLLCFKRAVANSEPRGIYRGSQEVFAWPVCLFLDLQMGDFPKSPRWVTFKVELSHQQENKSGFKLLSDIYDTYQHSRSLHFFVLKE